MYRRQSYILLSWYRIESFEISHFLLFNTGISKYRTYQVFDTMVPGISEFSIFDISFRASSPGCPYGTKTSSRFDASNLEFVYSYRFSVLVTVRISIDHSWKQKMKIIRSTNKRRGPHLSKQTTGYSADGTFYIPVTYPRCHDIKNSRPGKVRRVRYSYRVTRAWYLGREVSRTGRVTYLQGLFRVEWHTCWTLFYLLYEKCKIYRYKKKNYYA